MALIGKERERDQGKQRHRDASALERHGLIENREVRNQREDKQTQREQR